MMTCAYPEGDRSEVDAVGDREAELRPDDAALEHEGQRLWLALKVPHEGLVDVTEEIGAEAHLDDLLLARAQVACQKGEAARTGRASATGALAASPSHACRVTDHR